MTGITRLEAAERKIAELKSRLAEKDSDIGDNEIVDETTRPNEREQKNKKQPGDENEHSDEELDEEGEDTFEETERRRKRKQKKSPVDDLEDTSQSPPSDPRDPKGRHGDAKYWASVDKSVAQVLAVHAEVGGGAPAKKPAASFDDMLAVAADLPYDLRVKALSAAIVAADRRRREG